MPVPDCSVPEGPIAASLREPELDASTFPAGLRLSSDPDGVLDLRFVVELGPGQDVRTAVFGLSTPRLPSTGVSMQWTIQAALGLLVLGYVLLAPRRRRRLVVTDDM